VYEKREEDKEIAVERPVRAKKDHAHDKKKQDALLRKRRNSHKRVLSELEEEDLEDEMNDYQ
jgi:hypothetical protein